MSARVSGLGDAARLVDITCTVEEPSSEVENNETLHLLQVRLADLKAEKGIIEQDVQLVQSISHSWYRVDVESVEKMPKMLDFVRAEKTRSRVAMKELDAQIHEVQKAISEETRDAKKGEANGKISLILHADEDTPASLRLAYSAYQTPSRSRCPLTKLLQLFLVWDGILCMTYTPLRETRSR